MNESQKITWLASLSHLITHGFMTLLPAVLTVIVTQHSMSFYEIGIIANIGYFLYGLGAFPAGYLADRFGSKRILSIGVLGMSCSSIVVGMSNSLMSFGISYSLLGLFASIHHPAGLSLITKRIPERKGKALGIHGVMGNVGLFLTPLFGAICYYLFGTWNSAYFVYGFLGLVFFIIIQYTNIPQEKSLAFPNRFRQPPAASKVEPQQAAASPESRPIRMTILPLSLFALYFGSILSGFIFRGTLTFFPIIFKSDIAFIAAQDQPAVLAGFITTAVLSFGFFSAWFGGYISDKLKRPEFFPAVIFFFVTPALYGIARLSDSPLIIAGSLFSLVYYCWQPAQNYLIAKYSPADSQGKSFGINFFLIFGIGSLATATGGYVTDHYGVDLFYLIMAGIGFAAILAALAVYPLRRYHLHCHWQLTKKTDDLKTS